MGVVVFGSINMDLVAGVTRISAPGETVAGHSFATFPGGKGGNQALAAHRASGGEAAVMLVGKVGDDALGQELLGLVDILVPNETELALLSGAAITEDSSDEEIEAAARSLASRPDQKIVVTLGPRGALAVVGEETLRVAGRPVTPVDTTGAGDCFVGTLAAALARGQTFAEALATANAAASLSVQRKGAGPAMPSAEEIAGALTGD